MIRRSFLSRLAALLGICVTAKVAPAVEPVRTTPIAGGIYKTLLVPDMSWPLHPGDGFTVRVKGHAALHLHPGDRFLWNGRSCRVTGMHFLPGDDHVNLMGRVMEPLPDWTK